MDNATLKVYGTAPDGGLLVNVNEVQQHYNLMIADHRAERDALKSQVEQLRIAYKKVSAAIHNIDDTETDSEEIADALWSDLFNLLQDGHELCHSTPSQCLAEYDAEVAARAVNEFANIVFDESLKKRKGMLPVLSMAKEFNDNLSQKASK